MTTRNNALREYFAVLQEDLEKTYRSKPEKAFAIDRLKSRFRKKARLKGDDARLTRLALENFLQLNGQLKSFEHRLPAAIVHHARAFIEHVLMSYTKCVDSDEVLSLSYGRLLDQWRFGPGASNGIRGTHAAEKIGQPMTVTPLAVVDVRHLRGSNAYFASYDGGDFANGHLVVDGSRITTVPKNEDTRRTIAIEPSGNMAMQLAAGRYLEDALRYIGLDITNQQPLNKGLAREASVDGTMCTIDMKNASDRITPSLVRALFPSEWYNLFMRLRSPVCEVAGYGSYELYMVSTMGNGFTFPLMTMLFVALIYANRAVLGRRHIHNRVSWGFTAVFGDDLIVPTDEYDSLCSVLTSAGYVVNYDKSFSAGPFRESCGGDYWNGYDVTPFYPVALNTDAEIYVVLNQQLAWMARHDIVLPDSLRYLLSLIERPFLVPEWLNPDQGILTSLVSRRYKYLALRQQHRKLGENPFAMMLCCGGYITSSGPDLLFLPRPKQPRYQVAQARLPKGWASGWDPAKRSRQLSDTIAMFLAIMLA